MGIIHALIDGGDDSYRNQQRSPYDFRQLAGRTHLGSYQSSSLPTPNVGTETEYLRTEYKESYGHPVRYLGRTNRNIGGNFVHTRKQVVQPGEFKRLRRNGNPWREASGMFSTSSASKALCTTSVSTLAQALAATTGILPLRSVNDLDSRGATAISRVAPTAPLVDLSTSLAELLREGLPSVPGRAGNVGGEYLNIMFGVLPLTGDLSDLAKTARKSDKLIRQYERDAGRRIRRRYDFPTDVTTSREIQTSVVPPMWGTSPSGLVSAGTLTKQTTTSTRFWFEGAFTYYLPPSGWRRTVAELDHLYGIQPGIDTAWQLTGYSWLADYFANMGDVLTNINAFAADGLVMPYGYVMCEQTVTWEEHWKGLMWIGGIQSETTINSRVDFITHQRRLANPFGFGLSDDGLTGRQLSILAALGISRL